MTMKRTRNANNANGAVEFLDDGTVQVSDKTDRTKKLLLDASQVASGGSVNVATAQQVQDGQAKPSYRLSSTSQIITSPSSSMNFADSDVTFIVTGKTDSLTPASVKFFGGVYKTSGGTDWKILLTQKSGSNQFLTRQGSTDYDTGVFIPSTGWFTVAIKRYSGTYGVNTLKAYMNGISGSDINATRGTGSGDGTLQITQADSNGWQGQIGRTLIFNYALDEDKIRRYSAGAKLDYEDVGGSMTNIATNGEFTTDIVGWTASGGTATWIAGGQSGGCLQHITTTPQNVSRTISLTVGKRYRVSGYHKYGGGIGGTNAQCSGTNSQFTTGAMTVDVAWVAFSVTFTATATSCDVQLASLASSSNTILWDQITVVQLGAVLDLEPENITDTMWVDASPNGLHGRVTGALANRFVPKYSTKNYAINGGMDFWQRGIGPQTADGYGCVDRFQFNSSTTTKSVQQYTLAANEILDADLKYALRVITVTGGTTASLMYFTHRIEDVGTLAGKTLTVSFWGTVSPNLKFGIEIIQNFGSGGSATVVSPMQIVSVTGSWQRYSVTFNVPSIDSKTVGAGSFLAVAFWYDAGSAVRSQPGLQSGNFYMTGLQVNEGPVAAPFERAGGSIGGELALCQRYYEKSYALPTAPGTNTTAGAAFVWIGGSPGGSDEIHSIKFAVGKRTASFTGTVYNISNSTGNVWNYSTGVNNPAQFYASDQGECSATVTTTAGTPRPVAGNKVAFQWTADAEL